MRKRIDAEHNIWISDPALTRLFDIFPKGSLRLVGGCVRNALLGASISDIDLCTQLEPKAAQACLRDAGIRVVETGIEHGTITAVIEGQPFEITSLRKDVETDGRRAVVAFTQDWAEDAQRRDFTMNALYADIDGEIYDPTGEGLDDLAARRFCFVGEAEARIREDYLRLLRYFRFNAWYGGDSPLDREALSACRELQSGLKNLSVERIWSELKKLLSAPDPRRIIRIMSQQGVLDTLLPEASNAEGLALYITLEQAQNWAVDPLIRLMSMAARDALSIARLCKRLKLSKSESARLRGWAENEQTLTIDMTEKSLRAALYTSRQSEIIDRSRLRAAGASDEKERQAWLGLSDMADHWVRPEFPLSGQDLITAGVSPGPAMGRTMKALEALWVRSDFSVDKARLLMAVKMLGM